MTENQTADVIIEGNETTEVRHVPGGIIVELHREYDLERDALIAEKRNDTGHVVRREGRIVIERYVGPYDVGNG